MRTNLIEFSIENSFLKVKQQIPKRPAEYLEQSVTVTCSAIEYL